MEKEKENLEAFKTQLNIMQYQISHYLNGTSIYTIGELSKNLSIHLDIVNKIISENEIKVVVEETIDEECDDDFELGFVRRERIKKAFFYQYLNELSLLYPFVNNAGERYFIVHKNDYNFTIFGDKKTFSNQEDYNKAIKNRCSKTFNEHPKWRYV